MRGLSVNNISLSVQKPRGNFELKGVLDDGYETLKLFVSHFTGTLCHVDVGAFADDVGEAATNTLNARQSVHDFLVTIDIGVQQTDDVLELAFFGNNKSLK